MKMSCHVKIRMVNRQAKRKKQISTRKEIAFVEQIRKSQMNMNAIMTLTD